MPSSPLNSTMFAGEPGCFRHRQTVFKWLQRGRLAARQLANGQPWQITLPDEQVAALAAQVRRTTRSTKEAS